jgi:hypothetical protein
LFELYVVPVDKAPNETAVKVSGTMAGNGILQLPSGEYVFGWTPNSSRLAYIADQNIINEFELFTFSSLQIPPHIGTPNVSR